MAAKTAKKVVHRLKLVCKCGDCAHWELINTMTPQRYYMPEGHLKCMTCGIEVPFEFQMLPHPGIHWEKHHKNEK